MNESRELTHSTSGNTRAAVARYNDMVEFVKTMMKKGQDFDRVPGTDKDTLMKAGAEKLASFFRLVPEFVATHEVEDWDAPLFSYRYKCILKHGGEIVAEAEGSCNSRESKYAWRKAYPDTMTEQERSVAKAIQRRTRSGSVYTEYRVPNEDIYSQVNTIQKMAQKRAFVGAVLIACNASAFFTQDMEDIEPIGAGDEPEIEAAPPPPGRQHVRPRAEQQAQPPAKDEPQSGTQQEQAAQPDEELLTEDQHRMILTGVGELLVAMGDKDTPQRRKAGADKLSREAFQTTPEWLTQAQARTLLDQIGQKIIAATGGNDGGAK